MLRNKSYKLAQFLRVLIVGGIFIEKEKIGPEGKFMKEVKVLVGEEEKDFEEVLPQDEYLVLKATCSKMAIEMVKEENPDLMILDLELPGMNGMESLRSLRTLNLNIPVVAVSSIGTVEAAVEAMKTGARDYLTKPLNTEELRVAVRKGLQDNRQTGENKNICTDYPDIQTIIDEVKESMLEKGANLDEAKKSFEKRFLSLVSKINGDGTGPGKPLER